MKSVRNKDITLKMLVLLLFYTSLYAVNCEDLNREFDKILQDQNKVLIVVNQQEKIIIYNEIDIYYGLLFNSGHITIYHECDSNNDSIILYNIDNIHSYVVFLTQETILLVRDYFGKQEFINYQYINPNNTKFDYINEHATSFITATTQLLTAQLLAPKDDVDFALKYVKELQLEFVSGNNKRIREGSSPETSLKRLRTDHTPSPIAEMVPAYSTNRSQSQNEQLSTQLEFVSGNNKRIREGSSPETSPKRLRIDHAASPIAEIVPAHLNNRSQSQKEQPSTHNDPTYTLSLDSISKSNMQQVVNKPPKLISEDGSPVDNPEILGTNETASVDTKTPKFVTNELFREQLPPQLIDVFNRSKFFSKDYGVIFEIPSSDEISMNKISAVKTLNIYLSNLKPNQNLILVSKKLITRSEKNNHSIFYIVINKKTPILYSTEIHHYSLYVYYRSGNLRFTYNNLEGKNYIMLNYGRVFGRSNVADFYVFSELGNNTGNQLTSLSLTENNDRYKSVEDFLKQLFMGYDYYIDENFIKNSTVYIEDLISVSKTNEVFIFLNNRYYKGSNIDENDIDKRIGVILKPINEYSRYKKKLFKVSYISLVSINSEYRFLIEELDGTWTAGFSKKHVGDDIITLTLYNSSLNTKSHINITKFNLLRKKT